MCGNLVIMFQASSEGKKKVLSGSVNPVSITEVSVEVEVVMDKVISSLPAQAPQSNSNKKTQNKQKKPSHPLLYYGVGFPIV